MKLPVIHFSGQTLTTVVLASILIPLSSRNVVMAETFQGGAPENQDRPVGLKPSDWSGIREAHEVWRHRFFSPENGKGYRAANPGQQWVTEFDGRGFTTRPDQGGWEWGLELIAYGVGDDRVALTGSAKVVATSSRLTYRWDENLEEWFVNDSRGLEQGWILTNRPDGSSEEPLSLDLVIRHSLRPRIDTTGTSVHFVNADESASIVYGGLRAWDADGKNLAVEFLPIPDGLRIEIEEKEARYPITIDPVAQQAYLKASNVGPDYFGISVAIDADTAVVGAYCEQSNAVGVNQNGDDNSMSCSGAAYVFARNGTVWTQEAYLKASNTGDQDYFGYSVAISGDTIVVGAYGEDGGSKSVNGADNNDAPDAGAAYIFVRSGTTWTQQAYLKAENSGAYDGFGYSVSIDGDFAVVGAPDEDGSANRPNRPDDNASFAAGAAYIFSRMGSTWAQGAYLKGSGNQVEGHLGYSVAISGGLAVVGAYGELENGNDNAGAAYVFNFSGGPWTQEARLTAANPNTNDDFGVSVAIDGDTLIVGAYAEDGSATEVNGPDDNNLSGAGAAYVFVSNANIWTQQAYLKASNSDEDDYFGYAVAIDGDSAIVGAYGEDGGATGINGVDDDTKSTSGAAYLFTRAGTDWAQEAYIKASNTGEGDYFGYAVDVDGGTIFVGAYEERGSAASNGIPGDDDNLITGAGAAYAFASSIPNPPGPLILLQRPKAFPATRLRKKSKAQTLRVTNSGGTPLKGLSLKTSGAAAKDFLLTRPVTTLAPGASTTFKVTFKPSAKGTRKAILTARGNAPSVRVPLSGKGK